MTSPLVTRPLWPLRNRRVEFHFSLQGHVTPLACGPGPLFVRAREEVAICPQKKTRLRPKSPD